jgi:hypothetical protein
MISIRIALIFILVLSAALPAGKVHCQGGLSQKSRKETQREEERDAREREKLRKGGIYSVSVWKYQYNFGKIEKRGKIETTTKYDVRGNVIEEIVFNLTNDSIASRIVYKYNRSGKPVEEQKVRSELKIKSVHRYDDHGKKMETVIYKNDGSVEKKILFVYDNADNLQEMINYLYDGKVLTRDLYAYDSSGNMLTYTSNLEQYSYRYDSTGEMIELTKAIRNYEHDDSLRYDIFSRITFEYDSNGNTITANIYRADSSLRAYWKYRYNENSLLTEESNFSPEGSRDYSRTYMYDKNQNLVEDYGVERGKKFRNTYKYDRRGMRTEWISFDQINEPRQFTRYLYERYAAQRYASGKPENQSVEELNPGDTSSVYWPDSDLYQLLGCRIIAADGTYLGLVWADSTHPHSIINEWGQYGFDRSPTSFFNTSSAYGGPKGTFSPFNKTSPNPPTLLREGKFVLYVTENSKLMPRVSVTRLIHFLKEWSRGKN